MDESRQMVLRMLREGKVSVEEAEALLDALGAEGHDDPGAEGPAARGPRSLPTSGWARGLRTGLGDLALGRRSARRSARPCARPSGMRGNTPERRFVRRSSLSNGRSAEPRASAPHRGTSTTFSISRPRRRMSRCHTPSPRAAGWSSATRGAPCGLIGRAAVR